LRTARENTEQNCNIRNHQLNFMNMIISLHAFSFSFFCFLERNVQEKCRAGQEIKGGAKE
jgi:penicillin-binding protein-related factor A (putative recombinase)